MKLVLLGDGESPALLRWAQQLAPRVQLAAVASGSFSSEWLRLLPDAQRLALNAPSGVSGADRALLRQLPRLGAWLAETDADWLHAHGVTPHAALAWAARLGWRLRAHVVGTALGPDVLPLVPPGAAWRLITRRALGACRLTTADTEAAARALVEFGAREVLTLPPPGLAAPRPGARTQAGRLDAFEAAVQQLLVRMREISAQTPG